MLAALEDQVETGAGGAQDQPIQPKGPTLQFEPVDVQFLARAPRPNQRLAFDYVAMVDDDPLTVEVPREFHRRMAAIIDAVQTGMWQAGVRDLLGYATDYAFGQQRGLQTLVLKSKHRSAYVRLHWDNVMGDTDADRQLVDRAIKSAINELT